MKSIKIPAYARPARTPNNLLRPKVPNQNSTPPERRVSRKLRGAERHIHGPWMGRATPPRPPLVTPDARSARNRPRSRGGRRPGRSDLCTAICSQSMSSSKGSVQPSAITTSAGGTRRPGTRVTDRGWRKTWGRRRGKVQPSQAQQAPDTTLPKASMHGRSAGQLKRGLTGASLPLRGRRPSQSPGRGPWPDGFLTIPGSFFLPPLPSSQDSRNLGPPAVPCAKGLSVDVPGAPTPWKTPLSGSMLVFGSVSSN